MRHGLKGTIRSILLTYFSNLLRNSSTRPPERSVSPYRHRKDIPSSSPSPWPSLLGPERILHGLVIGQVIQWKIVNNLVHLIIARGSIFRISFNLVTVYCYVPDDIWRSRRRPMQNVHALVSETRVCRRPFPSLSSSAEGCFATKKSSQTGQNSPHFARGLVFLWSC
jgi:hypothetical protein